MSVQLEIVKTPVRQDDTWKIFVFGIPLLLCVFGPLMWWAWSQNAEWNRQHPVIPGEYVTRKRIVFTGIGPGSPANIPRAVYERVPKRRGIDYGEDE